MALRWEGRRRRPSPRRRHGRYGSESVQLSRLSRARDAQELQGDSKLALTTVSSSFESFATDKSLYAFVITLDSFKAHVLLESTVLK